MHKIVDILNKDVLLKSDYCNAILDVCRVIEFLDPRKPEDLSCPRCGGKNYAVVVSNPSGKRLWFCLELTCLAKMKKNSNIRWS